MKCEECRFFSQNWGECRRRAPVGKTEHLTYGSRNVTANERAWWPLVETTDWCGEFESDPPFAS